MTQAHKTPGNTVKIKDECFVKDSSYYPYYDNYKGHFFEVLDVPYPGHVEIKCISGLVEPRNPKNPLKMIVHDDELQSVTLIEKRKLKIK